VMSLRKRLSLCAHVVLLTCLGNAAWADPGAPRATDFLAPQRVLSARVDPGAQDPGEAQGTQDPAQTSGSDTQGVPAAYQAQEETPAPRTGFIPDVEAYVAAPLHWNQKDWFYLAGSLAAIGAAHHYDEQVRTHFTTGRYAGNLGATSSHDLQDALPGAAAIAATWFYASLTQDSNGHRETGEMVESAVLGSASAFLLHLAVGRMRPDDTSDPNRWFSGGSSFPSIHATAAFAIGTVLAESGNDDVRWIRRVLGYGIGAVTAYERLKHNDHWLSDTVAGAALGIATAHFVMNRHQPANSSTSFMVMPTEGGVMLTFSATLPQ